MSVEVNPDVFEKLLAALATPEVVAGLSDPVNRPSHYQLPGGVEVIDLIRHESYLRGNILKYIFRAPYKGSELQDLQKARKYLDWEIERLESSNE